MKRKLKNNGFNNEHIHGRAKAASGKQSGSGKRRPRHRIDADLSPVLDRALERARCKLGCDRSELTRRALSVFVGREELADAVVELIAAREDHEIRRLADLGFRVLARMNVEPLILPPRLPIVEYCRAVTAAASINEIRLSLREVLRLVASIWTSRKTKAPGDPKRPASDQSLEENYEGGAL